MTQALAWGAQARSNASLEAAIAGFMHMREVYLVLPTTTPYYTKLHAIRTEYSRISDPLVTEVGRHCVRSSAKVLAWCSSGGSRTAFRHRANLREKSQENGWDPLSATLD